jgi:hypothetical protein
MEITEVAEIQRVFIFDIGGSHTFRTIYTDGRSHPKNLERPTTAIDRPVRRRLVDTVGYNEVSDRSRCRAAHRPASHHREVHATDQYDSHEVTIDDPGAYTKPW